MTSSDKEFFTIYFDGVNRRLSNIETSMQKLSGRLSELGQSVQEIRTEQRVITGRLDIQDKLIWGGISWFTLLITALMFIQGLKHDKTSKSENENKSVFTIPLEAVKELINMIKHE